MRADVVKGKRYKVILCDKSQVVIVVTVKTVAFDNEGGRT